MWVIDIRHWLNEQQDGPAVPRLRLKVKKLAEVITWITSRDRGLHIGEAPKCWRRPKRADPMITFWYRAKIRAARNDARITIVKFPEFGQPAKI